MAAPARLLFPETRHAELMRVAKSGNDALQIHTNGNGKHPEKKGLNLDPRLFWDSSLNSWADRITPKLTGFNAYAISALAYACMRYRSSKLTEAPLWIAEEIDGEETWIEGDHPLAEILEQPNPDMEMVDLIETVSLYLDVTGRALLVKSRDRGKRVGALYPFSGDEFTVRSSDERLFAEFRVHTSKGQKVLPPEDVIFFRYTDPRNPIDGLGPLDAALSHLNISEEMKLAVQAALRNTIRAGGIAFFPNGQAEEVFERNRAEVALNFAGAQNAGKLMSLEGAVDLKLLKSKLDDLALGPIQDDIEAAVCSCFEIHPVLIHAKLGLTANSGLADTIDPALRLFYDRYAFPTWTRIERILTKGLLREVDDNPLRFIRFDKTKIRNLQADMTERTVEAKNAQGFWTLNEQRQHTGQPPIEDERGDEIRLAPVVGVPPSEAPAKSGPPVKRKALPAVSETKADARQRLWRKFDIKASRLESRFEKEAQAQFEKERREVIARLSGSTDATVQAALRKIEAAYTREDGEYHLDWLKRYEQLIAETFEIAGSDLGAEIGFDFDLQNPRVQMAIQKRVNKLAGNVTETTYQKLRDEVAEGRRLGEGISKIADRIRDNVFGGEITKARATLIARTETIGALNHGELIAAQESGVIRSKEWLTQGDRKVRDSHADIDGSRVSLESLFGNGLRHPGDQAGPADEVCNCRCTLLYSDEGASN